MTPDCVRPLPDSVLLDWWAGEEIPHHLRPVEEHLLACRACFSRAEALSALAEGVRDLVRSGRIQAVVTADVVEQLRRDGRTIREYRVPAGGGAECTVAPDDDVLVARLQARLDPPTRVDLLIRIDEGPEMRLIDLPCDSGADEVILVMPIDQIRASPAHVHRHRLMAVTPEGERLIGEYTFNHTPWSDPTAT